MITEEKLICTCNLKLGQAEQSNLLWGIGETYHNYNDSTPHSTLQAKSLDLGTISGRATSTILGGVA